MSGTEKKPITDTPKRKVDDATAAKVKGGAEPVSRPKPKTATPISDLR